MLQPHIPENLQYGLNLKKANANFTQLHATLVTNIQQVQHDTTVQQIEKLIEQYMHKGLALFKEAGEFLKDKVKVVPPEESGEVPGGSLGWNGRLDNTISHAGQSTSRKGKDKETDVRFGMSRAAAKRVDGLLKKLWRDPELVRTDPDLDDVAVNELWSVFMKDEDEANGGIAGERGRNQLALLALRDQLRELGTP